MADPVQIKLNTKILDQLIKAIADENITGKVVHDGVEYGIWQEFTEAGHPSLVPAFEQVTRNLPQAIGAAIEAGVPLQTIIDKAAHDIQALWVADVNVDTGAYKNSITVSDE